MPFTIVRNDITRMQVDAIVNAANTALQMGGGVCGAIFRAAGAAELQAACDNLAPIQTGEAVITPGFRLPAKYIIHTAGPVYQGGKQGEAEHLRACYLNSLKIAVENGCTSIAFPLISSGIYGYPKDEALRVATGAIRDFLGTHDIDVYLVVHDKSSFAISEQLLGDVARYIDEHHVAEQYDWPLAHDLHESVTEDARPPAAPLASRYAPAPSTRIDDLIDNLDEPFSATLLRLIDAKGKTNVEVYKRANLDRKLFSKIRAGNGYIPSKRTAVALAVSLELTLDETSDLLERAGFALSHSQVFDVIIEYFIVNGKYDIFEINDVLFAYDQPLLGA